MDKGVGFAAGGDDYMVKPFDPRELMMHIEAHLRRAAMRPTAAMPSTGTITVGRLSLDMAQPVSYTHLLRVAPARALVHFQATPRQPERWPIQKRQ